MKRAGLLPASLVSSAAYAQSGVAYALNRNGSALAVGSGNTVQPGANQTGVLLGMRHKF